jgi:UDP-GlcNAc:undecaprenyl-phosphate GlcNAc-1-phosphate transferase
MWIVGITNAVNLIDGLDGLAGGIVLFAGPTNFVVALLSHGPFVAMTMAALSGAVLGFLFFNFNPARIFMGDSGSYFLGYALSSAVLVGSASQKTSTAVGLVVPCLALGVPIFDTLFSVVRRFLERRPVFAPDRGHIHHRLLDLGLTHRRAVLLIYALSGVFCIAAVALKVGREWHVGVAIAVLCLVVVLFLRFAGYVEYVRLRLMRRGRIKSPMIEALRKALPTTPERLAATSTEDAVFDEVRAIVAPLELDVMELSYTDGRVMPVLVRHAARTALLDDTRAAVQLGDDRRGQATFVWPRSQGECTPDVEILLQVLVDMVQLHLGRVGSAWAKSIESVPPVPSAAPAPRTAIAASPRNELT